MAEFPDDVIRIGKEALGEKWTAELGGTRGWLIRRDRICAAIMAERQRPVVVASANDFPDAVFSSEELAKQYNEQQALTDPKVPRVYRKNATFVIDEKVITTA